MHPIRVDERGSFVSYELSHRALHRRSPLSRSSLPAFYELHYRGQPLRFNLSLNRHLLAPGFVSERRFGGMAGARIQPRSHNSCHMLGEVRGRAPQGGLAALSTCDGLVSAAPGSLQWELGTETLYSAKKGHQASRQHGQRVITRVWCSRGLNFPWIAVVWGFSGAGFTL